MVTLHRFRPVGMAWAHIPPLGIALYAHSAVQIIAAPVLIFILLSLLLDRVLHIGLFDPTLGGDPMLYLGVFGFLARATVYSVVLPAFGVVAEIIQTLAGRPLFWRQGFFAGVVATAALLVVGGGQPGIVGPQSPTLTTLLAAAALLTAVPVSWMLLSLVGTLAGGFLRLEAPLLLAMTFLVHVTLGGFLGLGLPVMRLGMHLQGTTFVVAQQHYLLVGGVLTALLAGVLFWWPKLTGTVYDARGAWWPVAILFLGTHLSLFPLLIAGARGLPRRVGDAPPEFHGLAHVALGGSVLLAVGLAWLVGLLWMSLRRKRRAGARPWGAQSLEWTCPSPPPTHNFDRPPQVEPVRS
jgi:cytochrome c oxidase subunit 1